MSERDPIVDLLARVARRLRARRIRQALVVATCVCGVAVLLHQVLLVFSPDPAVSVSLGILGAMATAAIVQIILAPSFWPVPLSRAAGIVDQRQGLHDELKTALWFLQRTPLDAMESLQVERARRTARSIQADALPSVALPHTFWVAAAVWITAGMLAALSPRYGGRSEATSELVESAAAVPGRATRTRAPFGVREGNKAGDREPASNASPAPDGQRERGSEPNQAIRDDRWSTIAQAVRALGDTEQVRAMKEAVQKRDAYRIAELLEAFQPKPSSGHEDTPSGPLLDRPASAAGKGLVGALQELFDESPPIPSSSTPQPALDRAADQAKKLLERLRGETESSQLRVALDDSSDGAQGETAPFSSHDAQTQIRGRDDDRSQSRSDRADPGAADRRVTQPSLGDGGNAEAATGARSNGELGGNPVFGAKTMRLKTQLERVRIVGGTRREPGGAEDRLYAETQAQRAEVDYHATEARTRFATEAEVSGERIPLAYRTAVREYFLNLNRKDSR